MQSSQYRGEPVVPLQAGSKSLKVSVNSLTHSGIGGLVSSTLLGLFPIGASLGFHSTVLSMRLRIRHEECKGEAWRGYGAQFLAPVAGRQTVHHRPLHRLDGVDGRLVETPPQKCLLGVGIPVVAGIEAHHRLAEVVDEASDRVLERPELGTVQLDDAEAGVHYGKPFKQGWLALVLPPSCPGYSEVVAGRSRQDAVHRLQRGFVEANVPSREGYHPDVVSSVPVGLGPRACTTAQIEDDLGFQNGPPLFSPPLNASRANFTAAMYRLACSFLPWVCFTRSTKSSNLPM